MPGHANLRFIVSKASWAGNVTQWDSTCLAFVRLWVQSPAWLKNLKRRKEKRKE
jgi:hypothetical protein